MPTSLDEALTRPMLDLSALFNPRSIAVIGASSDPGRHNGRPIANLLRTGFAGQIYPVSPRHERVQGLACYPTIGDIGAPVDLAYVMVRAELVSQVVEECAIAGVANIVVCTSGFAESGEAGELEQERIRSIAWRHGVRVIGPNCIGVISVPENAVSCTTLNITTEHTSGGVAIVSQSGGMATNLFNRAQGRGIGVRAMVSVGNEADVDLADVVSQLASDPATTVIVLYIEELRDFSRFREAVADARRNGKTVLAVKVGRSPAAVRSALSHTGAMAGSYDVFRDLLQSIGVGIVDSIDDLVDVAEMIQSAVVPTGKRVLVISPSGGECGYVADLAEGAGLEMPEMSRFLVSQLRELMRFGTPGNPLDLTGQVIGDEGMLAGIFRAIDESNEFDSVVVALPTWGEFDSRRLMPPIMGAAATSGVPMVITAWQSANLTEFRDDLLQASDVTCFSDAGRAVRALAVLAMIAELPDPSGDRPDHRTDLRVAPPGDVFQDEGRAKAFLADRGLPVSEERIVSSDEEAAGVWEELGWPLVVKGVCAGVQHKSDLGLVELGIDSEERLASALRSIRSCAGDNALQLDGYLLARQYDGIEIIVGAVDDPTFGPVLMLGAGGILAEVLDDKVFLSCPASRAQVEAALSRLRVTRILGGHRGRTYDVESLIDLCVTFSGVVAGLDGVGQIDLNPVLVGSRGSRIVDALFLEAAAARG